MASCKGDPSASRRTSRYPCSRTLREREAPSALRRGLSQPPLGAHLRPLQCLQAACGRLRTRPGMNCSDRWVHALHWSLCSAWCPVSVLLPAVTSGIYCGTVWTAPVHSLDVVRAESAGLDSSSVLAVCCRRLRRRGGMGCSQAPWRPRPCPPCCPPAARCTSTRGTWPSRHSSSSSSSCSVMLSHDPRVSSMPLTTRPSSRNASRAPICCSLLTRACLRDIPAEHLSVMFHREPCAARPPPGGLVPCLVSAQRQLSLQRGAPVTSEAPFTSEAACTLVPYSRGHLSCQQQRADL